MAETFKVLTVTDSFTWELWKVQKWNDCSITLHHNANYLETRKYKSTGEATKAFNRIVMGFAKTIGGTREKD